MITTANPAEIARQITAMLTVSVASSPVAGTYLPPVVCDAAVVPADPVVSAASVVIVADVVCADPEGVGSSSAFVVPAAAVVNAEPDGVGSVV